MTEVKSVLNMLIMAIFTNRKVVLVISHSFGDQRKKSLIEAHMH